MKRSLIRLAVTIAAFCAQLCAFQPVFSRRVDYIRPLYGSHVTEVPRMEPELRVGRFGADQIVDILALENWQLPPNGGTHTPSLFLYRGLGQGTFAPYVQHNLPADAVGLDCADIQGDEALDAATVLPYYDQVVVCHNDGEGNFTDVEFEVGAEPCDVEFCDFNNRLRADLVVANYSANTVSVLFNTGTGDFYPGQPRDYATGNGPDGVAACDVTGDGWSDIVTANWTDGNVSVLVNSGSLPPHFSAPVPYAAVEQPMALCAGQLNQNQDSRPDLVVVSWTSENLVVLINNGNGGFMPPVPYHIGAQHTDVRIADIDGDNDNDIVATAMAGDAISILRNNGDGTFAAVERHYTSEMPKAAALEDLDGNGSRDLVLDAERAVSVVLNDGSGRFEEWQSFDTRGSGDPGAVCARDLNRDGVPDVVVGNRLTNNISVFLNDGLGGFPFAPQLHSVILPTRIRVADLNGDGACDVVTAGKCGPEHPSLVDVFLNDGHGGFGEPIELRDSHHIQADVCLVDADCDGDTDIVTSYWASGVPAEWRDTVYSIPFFDEMTYDDSSGYLSTGEMPGSAGMAVWLNDGTGHFPETPDHCPVAPAAATMDLVAADINADGYPDICTPDAVPHNVWVFYNNQLGRFCTWDHFPAGLQGDAIAARDLNHDERDDIVVG